MASSSSHSSAAGQRPDHGCYSFRIGGNQKGAPTVSELQRHDSELHFQKHTGAPKTLRIRSGYTGTSLRLSANVFFAKNMHPSSDMHNKAANEYLKGHHMKCSHVSGPLFVCMTASKEDAELERALAAKHARNVLSSYEARPQSDGTESHVDDESLCSDKLASGKLIMDPRERSQQTQITAVDTVHGLRIVRNTINDAVGDGDFYGVNENLRSDNERLRSESHGHIMDLGFEKVCSMIESQHPPRFGRDVDPNSPVCAFLMSSIQESLCGHRSLSPGNGELCGRPSLKIGSIQYVLKDTLCSKYLAERKDFLARYPDGVKRIDDISASPLRIGESPNLNELLLFHGSTWECTDLICEHGFNTRLGGDRAGHTFGLASYFAENFATADLYAGEYNFHRYNGWCCTLVSVVLMGESFCTDHPCRDFMGPPLQTDSVWACRESEGGCVEQREFMIYQDSQALPLFRVWYYHETDCSCARCCNVWA